MRKLAIVIVLLFLLPVVNGFSDWVPYDFFPTGTKGMAMGGAFVSRADDLGAVYFNPAGLFQIGKQAFSYQMYSSLKVQRLINSEMKVRWEALPLLAYTYPLQKMKMAAGLFVRTLFKSQQESYVVRGIGASYSWRVLPQIAFGVNLGVVVGSQEDHYASGVFGELGLLWKISSSVKAGIVLRSPITLSWDQLRADPNVDETLPWSMQFGVSWRVAEYAVLAFELEYQGISAARYSSNGVSNDPDLEAGLFKNVHPHLGFEFYLKPVGVELRVGLMSYATAYSGGLDSQPALTLGVGAYTSQFFRLDFTLMDSLVFDIFTRTDRYERFLLSFQYNF